MPGASQVLSKEFMSHGGGSESWVNMKMKFLKPPLYRKRSFQSMLFCFPYKLLALPRIFLGSEAQSCQGIRKQNFFES